MKYLLLCFALFFVQQSFAQISSDKQLLELAAPVVYSDITINDNLEISDLTEASKLYSIQSGSGYFYRSYLVDKEGKSVSDGFMPQSYFMPNDNFLVITASGNMVKDSFNPYGAYDMPSMLILGTFNNFISRISRSKR